MHGAVHSSTTGVTTITPHRDQAGCKRGKPRRGCGETERRNTEAWSSCALLGSGGGSCSFTPGEHGRRLYPTLPADAGQVSALDMGSQGHDRQGSYSHRTCTGERQTNHKTISGTDRKRVMCKGAGGRSGPGGQGRPWQLGNRQWPGVCAEGILISNCMSIRSQQTRLYYSLQGEFSYLNIFMSIINTVTER